MGDPSGRQPRMLGYIRESPAALQRTLDANGDVAARVGREARERGIETLVLTGLGSSYTAALIAAPLVRRAAPMPVLVASPDELGTLGPHVLNERALVVAVSRSGERGWLQESVQYARDARAFLVAITASPDSLLASIADLTMITKEGPELSFPKTKSVIAAAGALGQLAVAFDGAADRARETQLLAALPARIEETIAACEGPIASLSGRLADVALLLLAGSRGNYGVAMEGAIKIQEAAEVVTVGQETGQTLHGALTAVDSSWCGLVMVTPQDAAISSELLRLLRRLDAMTVAFASADVTEDLESETVPIPSADPALAGFLFVAGIHELACRLAIARGLDPDRPAGFETILESILPAGRAEPA